jgi:(p)ppGpp synthase/HD superfamily hydrolase
MDTKVDTEKIESEFKETIKKLIDEQFKLKALFSQLYEATGEDIYLRQWDRCVHRIEILKELL